MNYTEYHNEIIDFNTTLVLQEYVEMLKVKPKEDILTWLGKNLYLPVSIGKSSYYSISEYPYLAEFFYNIDAKNGIREQIWFKSAQIGLTLASTAAQLYFAINDPCPQGVYMPTLDSLDSYKTGKFDSILKDSPNINRHFGDRRSRDTKYSKKIAQLLNGATIEFHAMGTPNSTASSTIVRAWVDEASRFDNFSEGNPISLIRGRTSSFDEALVTILSTPTKTNSLIDIEFKKGDQRQYLCPCPKCGTAQIFEFERLIFDRNIREAHELKDVKMECIKCNYPIDDKERLSMRYHGVWTPTAPAVEGVRSYYAPQFLAPTRDIFTKIARGYVNCYVKDTYGKEYKLNYDELKSFYNITLAKNYDGDELFIGDTKDFSKYFTKRTYTITQKDGSKQEEVFNLKRGLVPEDVHTICIGIDTQKGHASIKDYTNYLEKPRFEIHYLGFSNTHVYSIDYDVLHGSNESCIDFLQIDTFAEDLTKKLLRKFKTVKKSPYNAFSEHLTASVVFMDVFGDIDQTRGCIDFYLNKFSAKSKLKALRMHLIKGGTAKKGEKSLTKLMRQFADLKNAIENQKGKLYMNALNQPKTIDVLKSYIVNTNNAKQRAMRLLQTGQLTFASDYPDSYFEQFFSEKMLINPKTEEVYFEKLYSGIRNEFLDTTVYGLAAYEIYSQSDIFLAKLNAIDELLAEQKNTI